ncbi:MAG: peptidylprolyl isomerase [Acidilobaceae archaeon]|nr:peptidylprolyl isomerase [Acidilobaceae archaeon]MDW7973961.1 peptidylprolyl isomerase [Sulfolobales archaeon]
MRERSAVLINYTVKLVEEGRERVIDTTIESVAKEAGIYDPNRVYGEMIAVIGKGTLLPIVEEYISQMKVGERREVIAPPEKAYGPYREDLVVRLPLKQLQRYGIPPRVGEEVEAGGRRGRIAKVTERFAFIDFNHPLAGKTLKIEVELVRRAETAAEKISLLAARMLRLPPDAVRAEYEEGEKVAKLVLPPGVLGLSDLEARLGQIASDVYDVLKPKRLSITINIDYPEETKAGEQPTSPSTPSS